MNSKHGYSTVEQQTSRIWIHACVAPLRGHRPSQWCWTVGRARHHPPPPETGLYRGTPVRGSRRGRMLATAGDREGSDTPKSTRQYLCRPVCSCGRCRCVVLVHRGASGNRTMSPKQALRDGPRIHQQRPRMASRDGSSRVPCYTTYTCGEVM